jgi:heme exporter protein CcmD
VGSFIAEVGGKYAAFVWPAYGVSLLVFTWMILDTVIRGRAARRAVERLEREAKEAARVRTGAGP